MRPNFLNRNPIKAARMATPASEPATIPMIGPTPGPSSLLLDVSLAVAAALLSDGRGEEVTYATDVEGCEVVLLLVLEDVSVSVAMREEVVEDLVEVDDVDVGCDEVVVERSGNNPSKRPVFDE